MFFFLNFLYRTHVSLQKNTCTGVVMLNYAGDMYRQGALRWEQLSRKISGKIQSKV